MRYHLFIKNNCSQRFLLDSSFLEVIIISAFVCPRFLKRVFLQDMPTCLGCFIADSKSVVADEMKLVRKEMTQATIVVKHNGKHIIGECSSVTDIDQHAVAKRCLDRNRITEFVNHTLGLPSLAAFHRATNFIKSES